MKLYWQLLAACLAFGDSLAQSASLQMGARAHGMGNSSACVSDVWAVTANVAGLAQVLKPSAGVSYHAIPAFQPFDRMSAVVALPMGSGVAGFNAYRFGDDLYNEQVLSLGFANTFGLAALGAKVNYLQYHTEGFATRSAITISFGGLATITPEFLFGAHIVNINQPVINELTGEKIATTMIAGVCWKPSEKLIVAGEIEKNLQFTPILKTGMEYMPFKKFAFRTGFNFNPQAAFFGVGFKTVRSEWGYAMQFNESTGLSHQATVNLILHK